MKKRILTAVGVAVLVGGGVFASAATLNGITDGNVGASDQTVASCDANGVTTSYTNRTQTGAVSQGVVPATTGIHWEVASIKVAGIASACSGEDIRAVLAGSDGAALFTTTGQTLNDTGSAELVVPADTHVPAESVDHIAVVIAGTTS